jgi:hypothetical protein
MKFNFTVGDKERHQMEFSLDRSSGDLRILLDGRPVVKDVRTMSHKPVKHYDLDVGRGEKHKLSFTVAYDREATVAGAAANARLMVTTIRQSGPSISGGA